MSAAVNFIPAPIRSRLEHRRHTRWWIGVCVPVAGALLVCGAIHTWRVARLESLRRSTTALEGQLAAKRTDLRRIVEESAQLKLQIERAEALRSKRAWSGILSLVAERMPADCWLKSAATEPARPGNESTQAKPQSAPAAGKVAPSAGQPAEPPKSVVLDAPRKLRLSGYAGDPVQPVAFVTSLKEAGVFQQVALERAQWERWRERSVFRFDVLCEW